MSAGVVSGRPYMPEIGSFLFDAGFGPDGLFAAGSVAAGVGATAAAGAEPGVPDPMGGSVLVAHPFSDRDPCPPFVQAAPPPPPPPIPPRPEPVDRDFARAAQVIVNGFLSGPFASASRYIDELDELINQWLRQGLTPHQIQLRINHYMRWLLDSHAVPVA
jgi:hypothetical protein